MASTHNQPQSFFLYFSPSFFRLSIWPFLQEETMRSGKKNWIRSPKTKTNLQAASQSRICGRNEITQSGCFSQAPSTTLLDTASNTSGGAMFSANFSSAHLCSFKLKMKNYTNVGSRVFLRPDNGISRASSIIFFWLGAARCKILDCRITLRVHV